MGNQLQPTFANGKICYLEIPAVDLEESSKFYEKVFGWHIREDRDGNISFDDPVGQVSGMWMLNRKIANKPGLLISIMVSSITDTLKIILGKSFLKTKAVLYKRLMKTLRQQRLGLQTLLATCFVCTRISKQFNHHNP